jgi:hypothetical protein
MYKYGDERIKITAMVQITYKSDWIVCEEYDPKYEVDAVTRSRFADVCVLSEKHTPKWRWSDDVNWLQNPMANCQESKFFGQSQSGRYNFQSAQAQNGRGTPTNKTNPYFKKPPLL